MNEPSEYLTIREFATLTRVSTTTVYNNVRSANIPSIRIGSLWRIPRSALQPDKPLAPPDRVATLEALDLMWRPSYFDPDTQISELEISVRAYNALRRAGIETIGDIYDLPLDQLRNIPTFGKQCQAELKDALDTFLAEHPPA